MPKFTYEKHQENMREKLKPSATSVGDIDRQGLLRRLLQKAKAKKGITEPL